MAEYRNPAGRVFGTRNPRGAKPSPIRRTKAERELEEQYRIRSTKQGLEAFMAERRARIASKNRA